MNALTCKPENVNRQPRPQPPVDPLRDAQLHNFALRLDLRRLRRDLVGHRQLATTNRLLDATDAIGRALEWLRGGPGATDDGLEALEQLAMESGVLPDAVEAVAQ